MSVRTTTRPALVLGVMCAGMFLVLLDVTVVNVALPSIDAGLAAGTGELQWVVDGYAVAIAGLLLAAGAIGDLAGHRRVVLTGLALFGVASAVCGFAPSAGLLIAARVGQGLGAALLLPGSLAVIADAYPSPAAQARAFGIWAGVSSLALPAGPLLGGLLVGVGGWRLVFLINLPVVAAALVAVPLVVGRGERRPDLRPDLPGAALATLGLSALVFTVIDAGQHGPGIRPVTSAVVAIAAGAAFLLRQRAARSPMLPLSLVGRASVVRPNVAALLMNLVVNGLLFVTTLYLQGVRHLDALDAGFSLLPLFVPLAALAPVAGWLNGRFGPRPPMLVGTSLAALGAAGFMVLDTAPTLLPAALLLLGVGAGLFTAPVVSASVRALPAGHAGLASGLNNTARQTGTALGIAVFGGVAGSPADPGAFVGGVHSLGALGGALWLVALVLSTAGRRAQASTS
jgi:DHA2 family methylenomycin A resistance protein-like MFS transporter